MPTKLSPGVPFLGTGRGRPEIRHVAVEQRRLLDLAGMAGAVEDVHFAAGDLLLQCEGGPVGVVLAAGEDDGWTGDLGVMASGSGCR